MQAQWNHLVFGIFLGTAAWQDMKTKSISVWLYPVFGCLGGGLGFLNGTIGYDAAGGMLIGAALLVFGRLSGGAIGSGDGWFFVVSGIFLGLWGNFKFLLCGLLLCGAACMGYFLWGRLRGENVGKQTVPFLPFLIPAWIWMVFL